MRTATAYLIAPALALTGFRFSKDYRWGTTRWHRAVYACTSTVVANLLADVIRPLPEGDEQEHAPGCAQRAHGMNECDCGVAD